MKIHLGVSAVLFLALAFFGFAAPPDRPGPEKQKDAIKSLFESIPQDLRAKVRDNAVRCDRVNDWLQENVNGKVTIEVRVELKEVVPYRNEMAYLVHLHLKESKVKLLDADWDLVLSDRFMSATKAAAFGGAVSSKANFSFEGVNAVDAEKLADMKHAVIKGKVKEAKISRINSSTAPSVAIILEDVLVDGNKWALYQGTLAKRGKGAGGADNPFGKGTGKGKGGAGDGKKKDN